MDSDQQNTSALKSLWARKRKWLLGSGGVLAGLLAISYWTIPVNIALPRAFAASGAKLQKQMIKKAQLPKGYKISLFAKGMETPRLLAQTSTDDLIISSRGSKVYLVTPKGKVKTLMRGLNQPHGLLLDGSWLYIAEEHRVFRIHYDLVKRIVVGEIETVLKGLPDNGGHSSRTLKKGPDGWFYLTIGSSCNVCRERHKWRAAMLRFRPDRSAKPQIYATGLRNTVGFDWQPITDKLYAVDNGRDWLGDEFPPDELNHILEGKFYGWPFRHGDNIEDPEHGLFYSPDIHGEAQKPAFSFEAHIAPLSIRFLKHQKSPNMQNTALVAQHGSWNRSTKNGYRIVSLHFNKDGTISRKLFLTGFLQGKKVIGRPVDIYERSNGSLIISDDYSGALWLVRYDGQAPLSPKSNGD
ncbi:MAG: sorbosone dehydrogenase family protein [bacterium]|nr:sorbosone dehydrogenase family protein [bacterium]